MTEPLLLGAGILIGALSVYVLLRPTAPSPAPTAARAPDAGASAVQETPWDLLDHVAEGVLLLDDRLRPVAANQAAGRILGLQKSDLPKRLPSEEVAVVARRAREELGSVEEVLNLWFPSRATIKARAVPVDGGTRILLVLQDVTEESLSQQVRREFVSHASHELKSPVAGLQTLAEAVQHAATNGDKDAVVRFSHKMIAESTRLGRIISDLLDLSRLEDPTHIPDNPIDLAAVAAREVAESQPGAAAKSMQVNARVPDAVWVRGDDEQLALLVRNLLENAIRYTPEGGRVEIEVRQDGERAVLTVTDSGIGIPLEAQGRVFERFYRVDRARSRARGGTGLGLAIVKHVAELHGGEVAVQSELGRGSTFTAQLPAAPPPPVTSLAG